MTKQHGIDLTKGAIYKDFNLFDKSRQVLCDDELPRYIETECYTDRGVEIIKQLIY